jgi:hypothetical protein
MLALQLADESAAKKLHSDLAALARTGEQVARQQGDRVELQSKGYMAGDGKLADVALYREAMAGTPTSAGAAAYIDVQKAMVGFDAEDVQWTPVRAIGFASQVSGSDIVVKGRIVIR